MNLLKSITLATTAPLLALGAATARAHDGHGLAGSHWHTSDAWGFVAVAALLAVAVWLSRNGK